QLPFGEGGDGHGLVVEVAFRAGREGRDFAVRVEAGKRGIRTEYVRNTLNFFFDPLLQDHLAADTANQDCQVWWRRADNFVAGCRRANGAVDQAVEIGLHQAGERALWHIASKDQALLRLIDGKNSPDDGRVLRGTTETQGKKEPSRRQAIGMFAQ